MQGISYGQEGSVPTVTPGETNTYLKVSFRYTFYAYDKKAFQVQLRQKEPQKDWIVKCGTITDLFDRDTRTFIVLFTDLEPGTTYQVRYRETNQGFCSDNPPAPDPWSTIAEGTTLLINPPRVEFSDIELATKVRLKLGLDTHDGVDILKIPQTQLARLTSLIARGASDLTGLEHATQLTRLTLGSKISDFTPLVNLTKLTKLSIENSTIRDITGLEQLTQLRELFLDNSNISDITPLAQLTQLTTLDLGSDYRSTRNSNNINDITPLAQLTQLTKLYLEDNDINDITPLAQLTQLRELNLQGNHISDITPLAQLTQLRELDLSNNNISNLTPLTQLLQLTELDLSNNNIRDVTPLAQLTQLRELDLNFNDITDVTPLAQLVNVGFLFLIGNNISDITPLAQLPHRTNIYASYNPVNFQGSPSDIELIEVVASTEYPLTAVSLNGSVVTLTLSSGAFESPISSIRDAVVVSGIDGVTVSDVTRVSDTEVTVTLEFTSDLDGSATLTFTVAPGAIKDYNGPARTAEIPVSASTTPETPADTDAVLSISPASVASPAIGQQLEVSLNIIGGESVAGYQATVQFDATALRYVSGANGDFLPVGAFFVQPKMEGNLVTLNAASLAGESSGDGTLATLTFEVIAVKASTLTLSDVLLTDSASEAFVPQVENAEITESTQLKGDINGDGIVNIQDLVLVAGRLGQSGTNSADVNGDGIVNIQDLVLVAGALGTSAAAPSLHSQSLEMLTAAEVQLWLSQAQHLPLTDARSLRGILFLEQLLAALTPKETVLLANYPNPFNPETWIPYRLAEDAFVTLTIYDGSGQVVRTLDVGHQIAGFYESRSKAIHWNGRNEFGEQVASGVYFYHLSAGDYSATRKMLILK